jgi:hypothetical protein
MKIGAQSKQGKRECILCEQWIALNGKKSFLGLDRNIKCFLSAGVAVKDA